MLQSSHLMKALIADLGQAYNIDLTRPGTFLKLEKPALLPLSIEIQSGPRPEITTVLVAHTSSLNGDLMDDPMMEFWTRGEQFIPVYWENDYVHVYRKSVRLINNTLIYDVAMQTDQARFADDWARDIRANGFLSATVIRRIVPQGAA